MYTYTYIYYNTIIYYHIIQYIQWYTYDVRSLQLIVYSLLWHTIASALWPHASSRWIQSRVRIRWCAWTTIETTFGSVSLWGTSEESQERVSVALATVNSLETENTSNEKNNETTTVQFAYKLCRSVAWHTSPKCAIALSMACHTKTR